MGGNSTPWAELQSLAASNRFKGHYLEDAPNMPEVQPEYIELAKRRQYLLQHFFCFAFVPALVTHLSRSHLIKRHLVCAGVGTSQIIDGSRAISTTG